MELTIEELNVVLALCDLGTKSAGNELYRLGGGAHYAAAYAKLQAQVSELNKPAPPPEPAPPKEEQLHG